MVLVWGHYRMHPLMNLLLAMCTVSNTGITQNTGAVQAQMIRHLLK
jgi:hypothetical protein